MFRGLEVLQGLSTCASTAELTAAVDAIAAPLGVRHWLYAINLPLVSNRRVQFTLGGYPEPWVRRYLEMDYLQIDPIVAHCHDRSTPLLWADATPVRRAIVDPYARKVWRMFGEAAEFGLGSGISVPLHGPGVSWGLMSFAGAPEAAGELARHLPELHLLAHFTHEAGRRFAHSEVPAALPSLTPRERECLSWAAEGKTSWEIGQLLAISERTAIFHLNNSISKLGASGRQAAVARAISLGLIVAEPKLQTPAEPGRQR